MMETTQESPRTSDLVGDILRSIRLEGTLYFEAELTAPWGINIVDSGNANFHQVVTGSCFVSVAGAPPFELVAGESVVFPQGSTHSLRSHPDQPTIDGGRLFEHLGDDGIVRLGGLGTNTTTLICGHFSYDRSTNHPLLQGLPSVMRGDAARHPGWTTLAKLAVERSKGLQPASQSLTDRLAEVLLIELLSDLDQRSGFVGALADPTVAAALHAIHDDPSREWTVASLAHHVAASRSALASRFTELVGESPIRYLTRWRMQKATHLLRDTTLPASRIAELVGYSTPFSFTKAFVRELGMPPTKFREQNTTSS